jgi:hypothetical protein
MADDHAAPRGERRGDDRWRAEGSSLIDLEDGMTVVLTLGLPGIKGVRIYPFGVFVVWEPR